MKKIILIIFVSVCFFSCENQTELNTTIAGKWNVAQTIGGFSQPKDYTPSTFTWEFDMAKKTVTIINTADIFNARDIPSFINNQGGVYSFEIIEEKGTSFLVVGNRKGEIKLEDTKLTIDYGVALDDIGYIFKR
ncbi:MAG: hypothetical protein AB8B78_03685 [Polaribacter sp.]